MAGTHSGVGKTTVATGLMAALAAAGHRVAAAKVGPDFIDPGYHALACGRPPRNLDPWLCGVEAIAPLAARAGDGADLLVIEGVMGLFDGAADGVPSSTADVARMLAAPVILVVDASAMSGSVAALVHGFTTLDPAVTIGGVVLNQVGSDGHEAMLRDALEPIGVPVLGALRRDDRLVWRDRHLGLVPVAEAPDEIRQSARRPSLMRWRPASTSRPWSRSARQAPGRPHRARRPTGAGPARADRGGGRPCVLVHLHRHARRAGGRRRRDRAVRPAARPRAAGRHRRSRRRRRVPRGVRRRARGQRADARRRPCRGRSEASRRGPSAAACSGCPGRSTAVPSPAWSRPTRR